MPEVLDRRRPRPRGVLWDEPGSSYEWDFGRPRRPAAVAAAVPVRAGLVRFGTGATAAATPPRPWRRVSPMYGLGVAAIAALAAIAVMWTRPQPPDPGARHRDTPKADVLPADAAAPATAPPSLPVARSNGTRPLRPTRAATPARATPADAVVVWRDSRSIGLPWAGRLLGGVHLPAEGRTFFTWDPILRRSPNRPWRRFGSDRLVRVLLRVAADYRRAHPNAPRVAIGDLSRPRGGGFGRRFGGLGHVSHQNGLDADIYYPRLDRRELAPRSPRQIDRRLAQDLVNRFVRAGARFVFVGPRTGLVGPPGVVQRLVHHDDHMHVRIFG